MSEISIKEIPGFVDYFADINGLVYSSKSGKLVLKKLSAKPGMYYQINLYNGKTVRKKVHHLILETFVGPKPNKNSVARHLNDNPLDNRLCNLKWGNQKENSDDYKLNSIYKSSFYKFIKDKYPHIIEEYNNMQNEY